MIVDFHVDSGFLHHTATELSDVPITIDQLHCRSDGCRIVLVFGADDREAFDAALATDGTVRRSTHVTASEVGHWYSVETDDHVWTSVGRALLGADSFLSNAVRADETWTVTAQFPNKSTVLEFRDRLLDDGVDIDVEQVSEADGPAAQFGVTNPQREVLLLALRRGYFSVPRDASLSDLAADLDISSQAASERIRRGTRTLLGNSLAAGDRQVVESTSE